jgi:hypothetical protein
MNPNIVEVTNITGKTILVTPIGTTVSPTEVMSNALNSNKIIKLNTILATNFSSAAVSLNMSIYRTVSHTLVPDITVPANSIITVLSKDSSFYMEEGDFLMAGSSVAASVNLTVSYDIIG